MDGLHFFSPPAFELRGGEAHGINGRHRATLLMLHMDPFPLLITMVHDDSQAAFAKLVVREISSEEIICLPDLPKRTCPAG